MQTLIPSATLILLRDGVKGLETLLLQRHQRSRFLPDLWVFPGGGIEVSDHVESEIETAKNAAVRETFEEANLVVSHKNVQLVSQWITPEGIAKRFFTWFFVAKADAQQVRVDGVEMSASIWVNIADALEQHKSAALNLLPPTVVSLSRLAQFSKVEEAIMYYVHNEPVQFAPKVQMIQDQLTMLYAGDAEYEKSNTNNLSCRHRCIQTAAGWEYINEAKI